MSIIGRYQKLFNKVAENWAASARVPATSRIGRAVEKWCEADLLSPEARVSNVSQGVGALYGASITAAVCGRYDLAAIFAVTTAGISVYRYRHGARVIAEQTNKNDPQEQTNNLG